MELNSFENSYYYEADKKDVGIILLHAYTGTPNDVNLLARKLHREGYTTFAPMFPGHGTKDVYDILNTDVSAWFAETERAIRFMEAKNFDKLLVFGLSLGGILSTWALTEDKFNLAGGGLFNSPILSSHRTMLNEPFTQYANYVYKRNKDDLDYELDMENALSRHHEQMDELNKHKDQFKDKLSEIELPIYIAQSGKDEMIDFSGIYDTLDSLTNARIVYNYFPDNTHVITVNRNREDFEDSLIKFIEYAKQK